MKVEIESTSGFCFGVENAVTIAGQALASGEKVYCLGEIVHNDNEVERLRSLGLITIDYDSFTKLHDCKVLIRAHGEPPATYDTARRNNITLIDATCPIVHTLQERIRRAWIQAVKEGSQIVIYGKKGHAEVIGLLGQIDGDAILVSNVSDLEKLDYNRSIYLFSQTTMSKSEFEKLARTIRDNIETEKNRGSNVTLKVFNTICGQVSRREPRIREFARKHDVIVFVSGKGSSNGKMLFEVCSSENSNSHFISSPSEIEKGWFAGAATAGICGATSTPKWLIRQVADAIEVL